MVGPVRSKKRRKRKGRRAGLEGNARLMVCILLICAALGFVVLAPPAVKDAVNADEAADLYAGTSDAT